MHGWKRERDAGARGLFDYDELSKGANEMHTKKNHFGSTEHSKTTKNEILFLFTYLSWLHENGNHQKLTFRLHVCMNICIDVVVCRMRFYVNSHEIYLINFNGGYIIIQHSLYVYGALQGIRYIYGWANKSQF